MSMGAPGEAITGVILAGGEGSRMGGVDKGLVEVAGRPLVEHVLGTLQPQVDAVLISANRSLERYRAYGHPVITDAGSGFQGPLAGMAAALAKVHTPLTAFVPCDAPALPPDLVARLRRALEAEGAEVATAHDGERLQPAHALLRTALAGSLAADVSAGQRRIAHWFRGRRTVEVDFSDVPEAFANVDTPEERERMTALLQRTTP
ncbi:MAG: molybdenum cofactor guanylyltransferase MobA [Arhodomonas sp.]|nr:molybdenum cofactor guanylyltransferase MobA [Arhodomonas sp.]